MWRVGIIAALFIILFGALAFRLYNLQVRQGEYFLTRAESQAAAQTYDILNRGSIYFTDKRGNIIPAAMNKDYPVIFAVPVEMQKSGDMSEHIAHLHEIFPAISQEELQRRLNNPISMYYLLSRKASEEQISRVRQSGIKGIYVEYQKMRFYPFGSLASHLLGYLEQHSSARARGRYGAESYFNDKLQNNHVVLSIDYSIQAEAGKILNRLIEEFGAKGGTIIVEDPKTGKILAMESVPSFDPNNYSEYPIKNFLNPAVEKIYEPGSVFKVFTMAGGIDSGAITPGTEYTDTGSVTINKRTIRNWDLKSHGVQTMTDVLAKSLNTGAVFAAEKTGNSVFLEYMKRFGFDEPTGISLPGELKGDIRNLSGGRDIYFATASFGQGIAVTPIGLISAMSAIANNGVRMKPIIIENAKPLAAEKVMSESSARKVTEMMVLSVDNAQVGGIEGYSVAGKSGTAFIPDLEKGGYTDSVTNTYVGFAPAFDARATVLIKLEAPKGAPLAGTTVVPAFRDLMRFILNYYRVPPDRIHF